MRAAVAAAALAAGCALAAAGGAGAEIVQSGSLRVAVDGGIAPKKLPRERTAPVGVRIAGRITTVGDERLPQLRRIEIGINRHGRVDRRGLPRCPLWRIQPSSTEDALKLCRRALVGRGEFSANVIFPEQSPFPSRGRVLAFNGTFKGRPAILAHIYGTKPAPTSRVLPFVLRRVPGTFGIQLSASLPRVTSEWGYVTGISITLRRLFRHRGRERSFLSAACPAPAGFPGALFPLARARFDFAGADDLESTLTRGCRVRR